MRTECTVWVQVRVPPAALGAGGVGRVGGLRRRRRRRARDAAAGRRGPARLAGAAPLRPGGASARARARLVGEAGNTTELQANIKHFYVARNTKALIMLEE